MKLFHTADAMRAWSEEQRAAGKTIGFTPTMGALHAGHESLMLAAAGQNDVSVLSIYVNPTQFAPHEDFNEYPRTLDADSAIAAMAGVHAIYAPADPMMYPEGYATFIDVERITQRMCGGSRPHFFRGVATVVAKLFLQTGADLAFFG